MKRKKLQVEVKNIENASKLITVAFLKLFEEQHGVQALRKEYLTQEKE